MGWAIDVDNQFIATYHGAGSPGQTRPNCDGQICTGTNRSSSKSCSLPLQTITSPFLHYIVPTPTIRDAESVCQRCPVRDQLNSRNTDLGIPFVTHQISRLTKTLGERFLRHSNDSITGLTLDNADTRTVQKQRIHDLFKPATETLRQTIWTSEVTSLDAFSLPFNTAFTHDNLQGIF